MTPKERFEKELEPLLLEAEGAILSGDKPKASAVSHAMLLLVRDYADLMTREEMRAALNGATATRIAKTLGLQ